MRDTIPTFEQFINEGLWSSGMKRAENDDKRQEDIVHPDFDKYFKNIEWVDMGDDMPYLFAKYDYPANDDDEMLNLKDVIDIAFSLPDDIKIMNKDDLNFLNKTCETEIYQSSSLEKYISNFTGNDMYFKRKQRYFIDVRGKNMIDFIHGTNHINPDEYFSYTATFKLMKEKETPLKEGLWSAGMKRVENNEDRLENKVNSNIKKLGEIDLGFPFVFADKDFEVSGDNKFTWEQVQGFLPHIEAHGWRLLSDDDVYNFYTNNFLPHKMKPEFETNEYTDHAYSRFLSIEREGFEDILTFKLYDKNFAYYWCDYSEHLKKTNTKEELDGLSTAKGVEIHLSNRYGFQPIETNNFGKNTVRRVRLVKDKDDNKKNLTEGLWSAGMKRAENDEERIGDRINTNIKDLKEVDILHPFYIFADQDLEIEGQDMFTYEEWVAWKDKLKLDGWIVPEYDVWSNEKNLEWCNSVKLNSREDVNGYDLIHIGFMHHSITYRHSSEYLFMKYLLDMDDAIKYGYYKVSISEIGDHNQALKAYSSRFKIRLVKKKENLDEGLWSSGMKRVESDEKRMEDKIITNIKTLKEVELSNPYYTFADKDLEINGQDMFTYQEWSEIKDKLELDGWIVPDYDLWHSHKNVNWFEPVKISTKENGDDYIACVDIMGHRITYEYPMKMHVMEYLLDISDEKWISMYGYYTVSPADFGEYGFKKKTSDSKFKIRLVKKKGHLDEGLWSAGMKRVENGEKRQEDITKFDKYLPTIEWVDMGHPDYLYAKYDFQEGMLAEEIYNLQLPEGIHIMTREDYKAIKFGNKRKIYTSSIEGLENKQFILTSKKGGKTICFQCDFQKDYTVYIDKYENLYFSYNLLLDNSKCVHKVATNEPTYVFKLIKEKIIID